MEAVSDKTKLTNTKLMQMCPAKPVAAFANLLVRMREMSMILAKTAVKIMDMTVQTVSLIAGSKYNDIAKNARAQAVKDYHEIKSLAQPVLDTVSDIALDMILWSGKLGPWFSSSGTGACESVNVAIHYVQNVWCQFVIGMFPNFLNAMDNGMTWVQVGFQVVDDVFNVVLYGFLPEAYAALAGMGYVKGFLGMSYAAKAASNMLYMDINLGTVQTNTPFRAGDRINVAEDGTQKVVDKTGAAVSSETRKFRGLTQGSLEWYKAKGASFFSKASQFLAPLSNMALVASLALGVWGIVDGVEKEKKLKEALETFPDSWTAGENFHFDELHLQIKSILLMFEDDVLCMSKQDFELLDCDAVKHRPGANDTGVDQTFTPYPTQCWAEAQTRTLGVSDLYACTPSSTCAQPDTDEVITCNDCPMEYNALFNTFGCDTMSQQCTCSAPKLSNTRCFSHADCVGATATCTLLSNLDDLSFGTQMCASCATGPVCIVSTDTMSGRCTCLSAGPPQVDRCSEPGALQVSTHPSKMCGYVPTAIDDPYLRWSESALVLCANVASPTCAAMSMDAGGSLLVPVGFGASSLIKTASTPSRRLLWNRMDAEEARTVAEDVMQSMNITDTEAARKYVLESTRTLRDALSEGSTEDVVPPTLIHDILMENDTGWNRTAAPCSPLVFAYQNNDPLGPTDDSAVRQCAYWRVVGRKLLTQFNLSAVVPDTFLLSPDDMAAAVAKQGVIDALCRHPSIMLLAAMHHPWLHPLRAAFRASAIARDILTVHAEHARRKIERYRQTMMQADQEEPATPPRFDTRSTNLPSHTRRLLSVLAETTTQINSGEYSEAALSMALPIERQEALAAQATQNARNASSHSAMIWPAALSLDRTYTTCPLIEAGLTPLQRVLSALESYYTHFDEIHLRRPPQRSLYADLPTIHTPEYVAPGGASVFKTSSLLSTLVGWTGLTPSALVQFLSDASCDDPGTETCTAQNRWTATHIVTSLTDCNFEDTLFCSKHSYGLLHTIVFFVIVYMIIERVARFMGLPFVANILLLILPVLILWRSFGLSPACFPMVPPCLVDSVLDAFTSLLPASIHIPPELTCSTPGESGCLANCVTGPVNGTVTTTCLKSCSTLGFTSWQDPLAFVAAEIGVAEQLASNQWLQTFAKGLRDKQAVVALPDHTAHSICAGVTAVLALPAIMVLVALIAVVCSILSFIAGLGPPMVSLLWSVLRFDHANPGREPPPRADI